MRERKGLSGWPLLRHSGGFLLRTAPRSTSEVETGLLGGLDADGFEAAARAAWTAFFEHILPRYRHRSYTGKGCWLLHRLVADLDAGRLESDGPLPSRRARNRARHAAASMDFAIEAAFCAGPAGGMVLGKFHHQWMTRVTPFATREDHARTMLLYRGSFAALGLRDAAKVYDELLQTIAHEFVHYLESFLPQEDRTLANRETGWFRGRPEPTLEEARRRDLVYSVRWYALYGTMAVGAIAIVAAVLGG
jgi:hypothetical protein